MTLAIYINITPIIDGQITDDRLVDDTRTGKTVAELIWRATGLSTTGRVYFSAVGTYIWAGDQQPLPLLAAPQRLAQMLLRISDMSSWLGRRRDIIAAGAEPSEVAMSDAEIEGWGIVNLRQTLLGMCGRRRATIQIFSLGQCGGELHLPARSEVVASAMPTKAKGVVVRIVDVTEVVLKNGNSILVRNDLGMPEIQVGEKIRIADLRSERINSGLLQDWTDTPTEKDEDED